MRILVIEDYPPIRNALVQGLEEAGFSVDATPNGADGLRMASENAYDALVLDLMLPGIGGLTVLRRLREAGDRTQVLILTAKDAVADRVNGLDLGADDYLVKPFAFPELLARLRALGRRRYDRADSTLRVQDLVVHTRTRSAYRADTQICLTPREYALLELLAMRQGQVVEREEIVEKIYGRDVDIQSNVVNVFVANLRRKLDLPGQMPLLHTRRGYGYQLGAAS